MNNQNREQLLANSMTYLISFLVILWFMYIIDKIFNHPDYSSWVLTLSIPFFGLIKIVAKDTILSWSHQIFEYFGIQTSWNFNHIARLCFHFISLIFIIASLPFIAFKLFFTSIKYIFSWLIMVFVGYVVGFFAFCMVFLIFIPWFFQLPTIYNTFWNNLAVAFIFIWGAIVPIVMGVGAVSGIHQEMTNPKENSPSRY